MPSTKKYHNALKELFESERSYFNDLLFWQAFGIELEQNYKKYQFRLKVFSKFEPIVNLHRNLLNTLNDTNVFYGFERLDNFENKTSLEYYSCFEKILDKLDVYEEYIKNLPGAIASFKRELKNSEIFSCMYENYFSSKLCKELGYVHYISLPIQKIARYGLLLGAIVKNEEDEKKKEKYEIIKDAIEEKVKLCDLLYSEAKMWFRVYELHDILEMSSQFDLNTSLNLLNINRRVVKEGFVIIQVGKLVGKNMKYVILLDNVLVICHFFVYEFKKLYVERVLSLFKFKISSLEPQDNKTLILTNDIDKESYKLYFTTFIIRNLWSKQISDIITSEIFYLCYNVIFIAQFTIRNPKKILQICYRNNQNPKIYNDRMLFNHVGDDPKTTLQKILHPTEQHEQLELAIRAVIIDTDKQKIIQKEFLQPTPGGFWYKLIYGENVYLSALSISKSTNENNYEFLIFSTESGVFVKSNDEYNCIINEKVNQVKFDYNLQFLMVVKSNTIFLATFTYGNFDVKLTPLLKNVSRFFYCNNTDENFIVTLSATSSTDHTLHFFLVEETELQLNIRIITKIYFSSAIYDIEIIDSKFFVASYDFTVIDLQNNRISDLVNKSYFLDYNLKLTKGYFAKRIFKITEKYYLLCYSYFAFCVNKEGKYCESNVMMVWNEIPCEFQVKNGALIVFYEKKIQIFHIATGKSLFYQNIEEYTIMLRDMHYTKDGSNEIYELDCIAYSK